jgi:alpha-1,2-mannosyltransferase
MGYAFTYPVVRLFTTAQIISYTHYPTISTDMIQRVQKRQAGHTNSAQVARSSLLSSGKLLYYKLFAQAYRLCLSSSDSLLTNSTWTRNKIAALLSPSSTAVNILYPPCDVKALASIPLAPRKRLVFSLAQFRPEKEHAAQVRAVAAFRRRWPEQNIKLVMAGSVRNAEDERRVEDLRALIRDLKLEVRCVSAYSLAYREQEHVDIVVNAPYQDLLRYFQEASIGLSTMVDEHFGINIVELMVRSLVSCCAS